MPQKNRHECNSLVIEFIEHGDWLGGSIYIDNLLATLSVLPVVDRPRVRVRFLSSPSTPLAKSLLSHTVVDRMTSYNRWVGDLNAAARRVCHALVRRWSWVGALYTSQPNELFFPSFDARQPWRSNLFWIPDFQHHYLPELFDSEEISARMRTYNEIANSQGVLLLSSNAALADFRRFYPNATVEPRVWSFCSSVEPTASEVCNEILNRFGLPEKFLYIANQFWRHKDHITAFEALRILRNNGLEIPLVCTGLQNDRRDPSYFDDLTGMLGECGLQHQVYFLGIIPRLEQIQVFRSAAAVVQPSRFEGWSTVVEDAKALGRPLIASDIAVHREQLSGVEAAYLFRTSDPVALAQVIAKIWPGLQKGPIPLLEKSAGEQRDARRLDAARQFMAIADEAIDCSKIANRKNRKLQ